MKLRRLTIEGFGKLVRQTFDFGPGLNVVTGPNEAGKSTLASALIATLFGSGRAADRERLRPWDAAAPFATTLTYVLDDGREFEVQRDFSSDPKGVLVFDRNGQDVSAATAAGKYVTPGESHLGMSLDVFLNAACVRQQALIIDGKNSGEISAALARALDGGPREHAAERALERLQDVAKRAIGAPKATKNAPLRNARKEAASAHEAAAAARAQLLELSDLRARIQTAQTQQAAYEGALREIDRRKQTFEAVTLRKRIESLREVRAELAAARREREHYDDVAQFPLERIAAIEGCYRRWYEARAEAAAAAREAHGAQPSTQAIEELERRRNDAGTVDEATFAALRGAAAEAAGAAEEVAAAQNRAAVARRAADGGSAMLGALVASGTIVLAGAIVFAFFGLQVPAFVALAVAFAAIGSGVARLARRRAHLAEAQRLQHNADAATARQAKAAGTVAAILEPLKLASVDELERKRARLSDLEAQRERALAAQARAEQAALTLAEAAQAFDRSLAGTVAPSGRREHDLDAVKELATRKATRDGLDARVAFFEQQRSELLRGADDGDLDRELAVLVAAGADPDRPLDGTDSRRLDVERADVERRLRETTAQVADLKATLRSAEEHIGDVAALDERTEDALAEIARLEAFERALKLAQETIAKQTQEVHEKFARRLEFYADQTLSDVTAGRYPELRVDPQSLEIKLRAPETKRFIDVQAVSAGTRDQAYLVVRLAMARMFAEGGENPFVLLDDPFVNWDEERLARCIPVLQAATRDTQIIVFSANRALAAACAQAGARLIELETISAPA